MSEPEKLTFIQLFRFNHLEFELNPLGSQGYHLLLPAWLQSRTAITHKADNVEVLVDFYRQFPQEIRF